MKNITKTLLILFSIILFQNCEEEQFESSISYVSFGDSTYSAGVDPGGNTTVDVKVYTTQKVSSDVSFNVVVDPSSNAAAGSYAVPGSVTVQSGTNEGTLTIALSDVDLGIGVNKLVLNFDSVDANFGSGGSTTVNYTQNCTEVTVTLDFTLDFWASETGYDIFDALDGVVASKPIGTWGNGSGQTASESITLCAGRDYTLVVYDDFGDGMCSDISGSYALTVGGTVVASGGGCSFFSQSSTFDTN